MLQFVVNTICLNYMNEHKYEHNCTQSLINRAIKVIRVRLQSMLDVLLVVLSSLYFYYFPHINAPIAVYA